MKIEIKLHYLITWGTVGTEDDQYLGAVFFKLLGVDLFLTKASRASSVLPHVVEDLTVFQVFLVQYSFTVLTEELTVKLKVLQFSLNWLALK